MCDSPGFTESTIRVNSGEWAVREYDDGSWEILDESQETVGRFRNAGIMAAHFAMAMDDAKIADN